MDVGGSGGGARGGCERVSGAEGCLSSPSRASKEERKKTSFWSVNAGTTIGWVWSCGLTLLQQAPWLPGQRRPLSSMPTHVWHAWSQPASCGGLTNLASVCQMRVGFDSAISNLTRGIWCVDVVSRGVLGGLMRLSCARVRVLWIGGESGEGLAQARRWAISPWLPCSCGRSSPLARRSLTDRHCTSKEGPNFATPDCFRNSASLTRSCDV